MARRREIACQVHDGSAGTTTADRALLRLGDLLAEIARTSSIREESNNSGTGEDAELQPIENDSNASAAKLKP